MDCPDDVASYIHRVGRTARNNTPGKSLLFLAPSEKEMLPALENAKIPFKLIKVRRGWVGMNWDGMGWVGSGWDEMGWDMILGGRGEGVGWVGIWMRSNDVGDYEWKVYGSSFWIHIVSKYFRFWIVWWVCHHINISVSHVRDLYFLVLYLMIESTRIAKKKTEHMNFRFT